MSSLYPGAAGPRYGAGMTKQSTLGRPDARTAELIELALEVQRLAGPRAAAAMLDNSGVGLRLMTRVLREPHRRRVFVKPSLAQPQ